jgi:hypothetical protein
MSEMFLSIHYSTYQENLNTPKIVTVHNSLRKCIQFENIWKITRNRLCLKAHQLVNRVYFIVVAKAQYTFLVPSVPTFHWGKVNSFVKVSPSQT